MNVERPQLAGEEIANVVSHGVGLAGVIAATPSLMTKAHADGTMLGAGIFAASAALLYLCSTIYHATTGERKELFRMLDHVAIYVLIAGTYTPFALGPLKGVLGWSVFAVVWAIALAGVVFKFVARFRFRYLSTALYIGMGWLAVFIIRPLMTHVPTAGLMWMVAGGVAYTAGTIFYHREQTLYAHAVWHLFVLAGTACHFIAVYEFAT